MLSLPADTEALGTVMVMRRCPECHSPRAYVLADGRHICKACGHRYKWCTVWSSCRLSDRSKHRLVEWFTLEGAVYRQRFRGMASRPATERFYRLVRACCSYTEELREPFEDGRECGEITLGGARKGKRGHVPGFCWLAS